MMNLRLFLTSLLSGLRAIAAHVSARGRGRSVDAPVSWDHLEHLIACFERLYTDWRNGILPEPCERTDLQSTGAVRQSRSSARVLPHPAPPFHEPAASHSHAHSRAHSGAAPLAPLFPSAPAAAPPCSGCHHPRAPPLR